MLIRSLMGAGVVITLAGCAAASAAAGSAAPPQTGPHHAAMCEIRETRLRHGVRLEPVIAAHRPVTGFYDLVIETEGPGGRARSSSGGEFQLAAGESQSLGLTEFASGAGMRVLASLTLTDAKGRVLCAASTPI